ncbi:S8 family serine peptidase [Haloferula sp. A504]|uniref:S8 family serine peptidase n=1 Tax=Haloferula sp. A504 TaxID=3373601 RepID=UPI0031C5C8ED|nr:S8 family serine peptidase [Verrucomicrobiaceae bacterium E54]
MIPHGVIEDSGWALARLNDGANPSSGTLDFRYPESSRPVRLYLIDSAVDNTSGWFDDNANLTFVQGIRVASGTSYDPGSETASLDHGTRMLSVIAGPEFGVACGVPVELYSYDIYPSEGSNIALLVSAVGQATARHEIDKLSNPDLLGVICIANGTGDPTRSPTLLAAIDQALGQGLVVVVSAGNDNADALNGHNPAQVINHVKDAYLPAAYGSSRDGLITVGASTQDNAKSPTSNFGAAIDVWAPGVEVPTFDTANPSGGQSSPMNGTSPAAAMVAAAAIAELSRQPGLDPAGVEDELKSRLYAAGSVSIVQIDDDLDADGSVDELERFFGYPIDDATSAPPPVGFVASGSTSELSFTIDADLWQPDNPLELSDSSAWRLLGSSDLINWVVVDPVLVIGSEADGRLPVTAVASNESVPPPAAPTDPETAQTTNPEATAPKAYVATPEEIMATQELIRQLFESTPELYPEWYWETLGVAYETQTVPGEVSLTVTPTSSQRVFYRIEVIPNP